MSAHYYEVVPLWSSVSGELKAFVGLMPMLSTDWCRPWNEVYRLRTRAKAGTGSVRPAGLERSSPRLGGSESVRGSGACPAA
eukprot:5039276-Heterocapsa_arctica.AAC.1